MDYLIGQLLHLADTQAPPGFLPCSGQEVALRRYAPLYALIGARHGGDGRNTFGLPDLRGRSPLDAAPDETHHFICVEGYFPSFESDAPIGAGAGHILHTPIERHLSGHLPCDGSLASARSYPKLFKALGSRVHSTRVEPVRSQWDLTALETITYFELPDLRGRSPLDRLPTECHHYIAYDGIESPLA